MSRTAILLVLIFCMMQFVSAQSATGRWEGTFTVTSPDVCAGESGPWSAYLVDREGVLTGTYDSVVSGVVSGTSQGDSVRWSIGGSGGAAVSGTITGNSFSGRFTNGEDCFGFGLTSGTVTGSKVSGEDTTEVKANETTNNTVVGNTPVVSPPGETITQGATTQILVQSGADLQEANKLRQVSATIVKASTMANNGASTEAVADVLSNAGIMSNNYLNLNEVVANPAPGEKILSATEFMQRVRDETREQVASKETQADTLEQQVAARYKDLLQHDPTNFWANYDLATIARSKGDSSAAYLYYLKASEGISDETTAKAFREQAAAKTRQNLKLAEVPTPDKSSFISQLGSDASEWMSKTGTKLFQKVIGQNEAKIILYLTNSDPNDTLLQNSAREAGGTG
ncbi:Uncharacterised protein [uncultured archaeon]|nr:Uncharacterised protein [uncultured archaeon]